MDAVGALHELHWLFALDVVGGDESAYPAIGDYQEGSCASALHLLQSCIEVLMGFDSGSTLRQKSTMTLPAGSVLESAGYSRGLRALRGTAGTDPTVSKLRYRMAMVS